MVAEYNLENGFVVKYFKENLAYEQVEPSVFNSELMLIPSIAEDFIITNNEQQCNEIIGKDFNGDKKAFSKQLMIELSEFMYNSHNVAINLHPKKHLSFKFMGKYLLNLYLPFDLPSSDKNIYTIIQQMNFKINKISGVFSRLPDIGVFINGFLISYIELKLEHRNQNARDNGRGQIIGAYTTAIKECIVDVVNTNPTAYSTPKEKEKLIKKTMKYFHAPIHMISMDSSSAYVIRGIERHYEAAERTYLSGKLDDSELKKEIQKTFFIDAVCEKKNHLTARERVELILSNLYSKDKLQNEILYYNFLYLEKQSDYSTGNKVVKNTSGISILNFPRPNQKLCVEETLNEVLVKYQNELTPDYEVKKLETKLKNFNNLSEEMTIKQLEKRKSYNNNNNQYSLLLQAAAGFGKTYIQCWLAIMLKDMKTLLGQDKGQEYLFDKILLISDRVDLRDQIDRAMRNMNIEPGLFAEADNRDTLKKLLTSNSNRIIIVNIQKFPFLKEMIGKEELSLFKDKRITFIIDEIHRSNTGEQHNSMTSLFDEVSELGVGNTNKKNLIIGLTATPTDENLERFGEYNGCLEGIKWLPFFCYSMREAIADGFILDPTKTIIPYVTTFGYQDDERETFNKRVPTLKEEYEYNTRIQAISKKTAEILVTTTFRKIGGYAKAMFVCNSIESAKKYYDAIKEELRIITSEKKHSNLSDAKVYIVYTGNQEDKPAYSSCGYSSEKEVISSFKRDKNGIIIVVNKLQTGFDEPKLHTLFFDREVWGIYALQSVCRINRTCKNKEDCMVIDFSIKNNNLNNIREAFAKYSDMTVSEYDKLPVLERMQEDYTKVMKTNCITKFFKNYADNKSNIDLAFILNQYLEDSFKTEQGKILVKNEGELFINYTQRLGLVDHILLVDDKYKDKNLLAFIIEYNNLLKNKFKTDPTKNLDVIDYWFDHLGQVEGDALLKETMINKKKKNESDFKFGDSINTGGFDILELIKSKNMEERELEALIESYKTKLFTLFDKFIAHDQKQNEGRLIFRIKEFLNDSSVSADLSKEMEIVFNGTSRRTNDVELKPILLELKENIMLVESDFIKYITEKGL